ncbi:hypothetical protein VE04_03596 [Pseudogymnoascus sp. 24MN13]|nr:hypothetical protein VE04_03596 [Pseudogymnoascus sp. 24MN13]
MPKASQFIVFNVKIDVSTPHRQRRLNRGSQSSRQQRSNWASSTFVNIGKKGIPGANANMSRMTLGSAMKRPTEPAKDAPIELLCQIILELDHDMRKACRLVCRSWSAAASLIVLGNITCHQDTDIIESLQRKGLWAEVKEISASWSRGHSDVLVESLTSALSPTSTINIRCLGDLQCRCCPLPVFEPEETTFWSLLSAISRTNIQIKRLVLSNSIFSTFSPFMLPLMRNLISGNLKSLEEFFYAYPYPIAMDTVTAEEAEGAEEKWEEDDELKLNTFLYACPGLKTLFLNIYSFADLPSITMPHLTDLRVEVVKYDRHFPEFLKRHRNIQRLTISIRHWTDDQISEIDTSDYERCEIFHSDVNPWTGRLRTVRRQ